LGYIVSPDGITLSSRHVEAVKNFPVPRKVIQVQRFLGLTNYFRKFIKDYATKARPLHNLLKKSIPFDFNDKCFVAFNTLKNELISFPVLSIYNPFLDTEIHTQVRLQSQVFYFEDRNWVCGPQLPILAKLPTKLRADITALSWRCSLS